MRHNGVGHFEGGQDVEIDAMVGVVCKKSVVYFIDNTILKKNLQ